MAHAVRSFINNWVYWLHKKAE